LGKIRWTEKASSNLYDIFDYIAKDSEVYAAYFVKSLINTAKKIETFPLIGRNVPELTGTNFRELIYKNYRIVYRILEENKGIEIIAVVHAARDMTKLLG
jgi:toxin ParE1/3/4